IEQSNDCLNEKIQCFLLYTPLGIWYTLFIESDYIIRQGEMSMYRNLLVAMDGSDHSKRAAKEAIRLVKDTPGAEVTIAYAIDYDKAEKEISKGQTNEQVAAARKEFL